MNIKKILYYGTTVILVLYCIIHIPVLLSLSDGLSGINSPNAWKADVYNAYKIIGYIIFSVTIFIKCLFWKNVDKPARKIDMIICVASIIVRFGSSILGPA